MIELIRKNAPQYKANLHAHSTFSDGNMTPEEMKAAYKARGYSILAITDHNNPRANNELTEPDFLSLTGYEANIRDGEYSPYTPEVHLCLYARDPDNQTYIGYDPQAQNYLKYIRDRDAVTFIPTASPRVYTPEYINEFIASAKEHGYIVTHNHYTWSQESEAQVLAYEGLVSMEICNGGCMKFGEIEYNAQLYDKMLRRGMRVACHGTDDNHNAKPGAKDDSFIAWTYVLSDNLTYDAVFSALEHQNFYASRGPQIYSLTVDGRHAHLECSKAKAVFAYFGAKDAKRAFAEEGEWITSAEFDLPESAKYVRFSVFDEHGKTADTRGYFADELGWDAQ